VADRSKPLLNSDGGEDQTKKVSPRYTKTGWEDGAGWYEGAVLREAVGRREQFKKRIKRLGGGTLESDKKNFDNLGLCAVKNSRELMCGRMHVNHKSATHRTTEGKKKQEAKARGRRSRKIPQNETLVKRGLCKIAAGRRNRGRGRWDKKRKGAEERKPQTEISPQ